MDGVLADFDKGFYMISGLDPNKITDEDMWARIQAYGKPKFFSELPEMPGAKHLWKFASDNFMFVKILSATGKDIENVSKGKVAWLRHNISGIRMDDIILVPNKHKKRHYSKPGDIIIDDTPVVIEEWIHKGGIGILHESAEKTIKILEQYI